MGYTMIDGKFRAVSYAVYLDDLFSESTTEYIYKEALHELEMQNDERVYGLKISLHVSYEVDPSEQGEEG